MSEEEICGLIFAIFICVLVFGSIIGCIICVIRDEMLHKKYGKKYSTIEQMKKQRSDMVSNHCDFWNNKILPLHNKIDYLERDLKYLPVKEKQQTIEKIEKLKEESFILQQEWELAGIVEDDLLNKIKLEIINTNDQKYIKYNKNLDWITDEDLKNFKKEKKQC